jgi:hypothetical protein
LPREYQECPAPAIDGGLCPQHSAGRLSQFRPTAGAGPGFTFTAACAYIALSTWFSSTRNAVSWVNVGDAARMAYLYGFMPATAEGRLRRLAATYGERPRVEPPQFTADDHTCPKGPLCAYWHATVYSAEAPSTCTHGSCAAIIGGAQCQACDDAAVTYCVKHGWTTMTGGGSFTGFASGTSYWTEMACGCTAGGTAHETTAAPGSRKSGQATSLPHPASGRKKASPCRAYHQTEVSTLSGEPRNLARAVGRR